MEYHVLKKSEQKTAGWSAGKTTELGIYPKGASVKNRDFLWRLSSATCDQDKATFTGFDGYKRVLIPIGEGEVKLTHKADGGEDREVVLNELEKDEFDGGEETVAEGLKKDYNVIVSEKLKYNVEVIDQILAGAGVNQDQAKPVGDGDQSFLSIDSIMHGKRFPLKLGDPEGYNRVTQAIYAVDGFSSIHIEVTDMTLVTNAEDAPVDIKILRLSEGEQLICDYLPTEKIRITIKGAGRLVHTELFYND